MATNSGRWIGRTWALALALAVGLLGAALMTQPFPPMARAGEAPAHAALPAKIAATATASTASAVCEGLSVADEDATPRCIVAGSGASFRDCKACPEMVLVPAGTFTMGARPGERATTIPPPASVGTMPVPTPVGSRA